MNIPDDVDICLRLLAGHWPSPAITDEEASVWTRTLAGCDFNQAIDVMDAIAASGAKWRPNDGEFLVAYRQHSIQRPAPRPELSEPPSKESIRKSWGQYFKLQLAGEVGPAESTEEMLAVMAERDIAGALLEATAPKDGRLDYGAIL